MPNKSAELEALLFAAGDPLSIAKIAECLDYGELQVKELLTQLEVELKDRGIMLRETASGWQLTTRPEYFPTIEKLASVVNLKLSTPMMETLSIIAFLQPVTKIEIEEIRGVKVDRLIARLMDFDLIEEVGRKPVIGRPILYGTTENFLQSFGLKSLKELPELPALE